MKVLITIILTLQINFIFSQTTSFTIKGVVRDEKSVPINHVKIFYGPMQSSRFDSTETDSAGSFTFTGTFKNFGYFLLINKNGFFEKQILVQNLIRDNKYDTIITLRSRLDNWYSAKQIDNSDLGMTFSQAIAKYKLDIIQCYLVQEPIDFIVGLRAELADSSYIMLYTKYYFDSSLNKKENILNRKITAIGVEDINGHQIFFGKTSGYGLYNLYYENYLEEQKWKKYQDK